MAGTEPQETTYFKNAPDSYVKELKPGKEAATEWQRLVENVHRVDDRGMLFALIANLEYDLFIQET